MPSGSGDDATGMDSVRADSLAEAQLYALVDVAAGAAAAHRLDEVLELAAERSLEAIGGASLSIGRWESGWIVTLINVGQLGPGEARFPRDERYPLDQYPNTARVLASGGMTVATVDDPATDPAHRELLRRLEKESSLTVPIVFEGSTWGELWAASGTGQPRLTERDGVFLRAIADQIAAAIGRAELFAQLEALAYTDPLTGLANRRVLEQELERTCDNPAGPGSPALLLCDIDGLKAVNDASGHEAGDRVILKVAAALAAAAADHDDAVVSRMGGDEFCVLLPSGDAAAAQAVGEEAARRVGATDALPVGISCGVAARAEGLDRPAALLRAADFAQYRAKHAGPDVSVEAAGPNAPVALPRADGPRAFRGRADNVLADELLELIAARRDEPATELLDIVRARLADARRRSA
jgi:diguanylate cyclase (GGDEF)-like protein